MSALVPVAFLIVFFLVLLGIASALALYLYKAKNVSAKLQSLKNFITRNEALFVELNQTIKDVNVCLKDINATVAGLSVPQPTAVRNELDILRKPSTDSMDGGGNIYAYRQRSVLFLHNSYYHFHYLSKGLKARGWDAVTVSYESPLNGVNTNYYHGEDINLFDPDPEQFRRKLALFFETAKHRFELLHFAGDGLLSFFPDNWSKEHPEDIVEWKNLGRKIAYTISGCNSGIAQSSVAKWSALDNGQSVCDKCAWQTRPDVCRDEKNLAWGQKVEAYCDLVFAEGNPALDYLDSYKVIYEPTTMALSPLFWTPDLFIPDKFKIQKQPEEVLIYHAIGNYQLRTRSDGNNIKGTPAIADAVERLKSEGHPVRLIFVTGVKNTDVRYTQAQADIVVDQLNFGRYGAISRESMMLGKPTICYLNYSETKPGHRPVWFDEVPLVSATEECVYDVLKDLVCDRDKRQRLGDLSRQYALKWHADAACAERYEKIYDQLMSCGHVQPEFVRSLFLSGNLHPLSGERRCTC